MKQIKYISLSVLFLIYLTSTIVHSDFWGDLLSPIISMAIFVIVFNAFYMKQTTKVNRCIGLFLSLSILSWVAADVLWAIYDLIYHIDPDTIDAITYLYSLTNVFLTISITIYGYQVFRKWNVVQMILDSTVMSFLIFQLVWIMFLGEDVNKISALLSDWVSFASIILDVIIALWIIIWYVSVRSGRIPLFMCFITCGYMLFCIIDLIYFYRYLNDLYQPNTLIDALYIIPFLSFAIAAFIRTEVHYNEGEVKNYNVGRKGKAYLLLLAPIIMVVFKRFDVTSLLQSVTVILLYNMISNYVQNNIYKEGLLLKEKELTTQLEQKVNARTVKLEENNKILQDLINRDYVTGLFNRIHFLSYLEKATANLKQEETIVLLYIDINRFKMLKTMYGHYIGEMILIKMADKLRPIEKLAEETILASYGDDTYIFAAIGPYDYEQGHEFAEEAIRLCSDLYQIDDYQIKITVNIGISIFPYDAITKDDLIKHADIAMTQARMQGFNKIQEFDVKLSNKFLRKSNIELMLKKANFKKDFMVYYQPQLQTQTKKIIGFEALLRWKTSTGEFISPAEFIPVAEETGCIIPIGDWVTKTVMYQLLDWNNYFDEKIMIGINVSLKQLNSIDFFERLKEDINKLQIKPEWIDLEITESLEVQENPEIITMLEDIRNFGVKVSIDDFGTGYSSLSYLNGLPVDRIKLARELIESVHTDDFDYQLVKSIIQLSKIKNIKVIAEGIETKEQWETLKELQCDEVQGYYFGRPVPVKEIEDTFGNELMAKK